MFGYDHITLIGHCLFDRPLFWSEDIGFRGKFEPVQADQPGNLNLETKDLKKDKIMVMNKNVLFDSILCRYEWFTL